MIIGIFQFRFCKGSSIHIVNQPLHQWNSIIWFIQVCITHETNTLPWWRWPVDWFILSINISLSEVITVLIWSNSLVYSSQYLPYTNLSSSFHETLSTVELRILCLLQISISTLFGCRTLFYIDHIPKVRYAFSQSPISPQPRNSAFCIFTASNAVLRAKSRISRGDRAEVCLSWRFNISINSYMSTFYNHLRRCREIHSVDATFDSERAFNSIGSPWQSHPGI